ncbi:MAG: SDR family oxidoreductase [Candidatus Dormibacteraeota bacterium]|nr:SDR family oxidoreductase [Candidatus Dormibacteraeota bacterium]
MKPLAIVTGASGGLGLAIAAELRARGYKIVGLNRSSGVDVSDEKQVVAAFDGLDRLDVLVNNAAVLIKKPVAETTAAEWDEQLGSGLRAAFLCSREAFRGMREGGSIVNVSSLSGMAGTEKFPGMAAYAAAKSGLAALTEVLAVEGRPLGIRVNAVSPGAIDTPMLEISGVTGRKFAPAEVARIVGWLASSDSGRLTGANLKLDP